MGSSASSTISNNITNKIVNKSDLESLNSSATEFVTNSIMKNTNTCGTGTTQMNDNDIGDITVVGKNNKSYIELDTQQDSRVSLECIQASIQQSNISNDLATSLMTNLNQSVSNAQMTQLVNTAEATNSGGIFSRANASINMNLSNIQETTTSRKLSNFISNKVASNMNTSAVKDCFNKVAQQQQNTMGNLKIGGTGNTVNVNISTKQYAQSFATCEQLSQQAASTTNDMAQTLGLTIVDKTESKMASDVKNKAKATTSWGSFASSGVCIIIIIIIICIYCF